MKKTLITLAALAMASVASAADMGVGIADATYQNPGSTGTSQLTNTQFSNAQADFTLQLVIDWDKMMSSVASTWQSPTLIMAGANSDMWYKMGLGMWIKDETNLYLSLRHESSVETLTIDGLTSGGDSNDSILFTNDMKNTYTDANGMLTLFASHDSTAKTLTLFVVNADGSLSSAVADVKQVDAWPNNSNGTYTHLQVTAGDTSSMEGVITSISTFNEAMDQHAVKYYMQTSIPEPATATLSLLALAGLAARRRRK